MTEPLSISIITPCLNRAAFVAEAIESTQGQSYTNVEHIVMDGGSTDGTLEVLSRFPHVQVASKKDQGIYDAIDQGIHRAKGEIIGILNTDDLYMPALFESVVETFLENPNAEAVSGGASIFYCNERGERVTWKTFSCIEENQFISRVTQGAPIFNAWFFRKRLFDRIGAFDLHYRYVADRDFLIRMALRNIPFASVDRLFYQYRMHPDSYTLSGKDSGEAAYMFENRALAERYLSQKGIGPEAVGCLRTWHSQIVLEHIMAAWRERSFRRISQYMLVGMRHNRRWPVLFLRKFIERLPYILSVRKEETLPYK